MKSWWENIKAFLTFQHTMECSRESFFSKVLCFVKAKSREGCRKDLKSLNNLFFNYLFNIALSPLVDLLLSLRFLFSTLPCVSWCAGSN